MATSNPQTPPAETGIPGLDDVLRGGFTRSRLFLVEGVPGSGKTTLALQFLRAGAARGETVLYITLAETEAELREVAGSHGWDLEGLAVTELTPTEEDLDPSRRNTMFHPSEVELADTTRRLLDDVERVKPSRVVVDSLSELRLLAGNPLRYRRQILALKQYFAKRDCTVLLLDDMTASDHDLQMRSIAHGVVLLDQAQPEYGSQRRRLTVVKYRGVHFRGGFHDYAIETGGLRVYPRLVAAEHRQIGRRVCLSSNIPSLDALLGGGIDEGTSTLVIGAPGTGKSTIAAQFAAAAASRGQRAAMFLFDESPQTMASRCEALGIDLKAGLAAGLKAGLAAGLNAGSREGTVTIQPIDPAEFTPGALIAHIRREVEQGARMIVIDSLNGYLNAMPQERFLTIQLHELLMYLGQQGVATVLTAAHQGLIGTDMSTPVDASYLADAVILLRYFELRGEVRQAVSVVKKRGGAHERTIREFHLGAGGITVGGPLRDFRGVLTGVPIFEPAAVAES